MTPSSEVTYANMRAYVSKVLTGGAQGQDERPLWYSACPKCSKKVVGDEQSGHSCESCGWSGAECTYTPPRPRTCQAPSWKLL